jgi:hypothetical protein
MKEKKEKVNNNSNSNSDKDNVNNGIRNVNNSYNNNNRITIGKIVGNNSNNSNSLEMKKKREGVEIIKKRESEKNNDENGEEDCTEDDNSNNFDNDVDFEEDENYFTFMSEEGTIDDSRRKGREEVKIGGLKTNNDEKVGHDAVGNYYSIYGDNGESSYYNSGRKYFTDVETVEGIEFKCVDSVRSSSKNSNGNSDNCSSINNHNNGGISCLLNPLNRSSSIYSSDLKPTHIVPHQTHRSRLRLDDFDNENNNDNNNNGNNNNGNNNGSNNNNNNSMYNDISISNTSVEFNNGSTYKVFNKDIFSNVTRNSVYSIPSQSIISTAEGYRFENFSEEKG